MGKWSVINSMLNVEINPSDKMVLSRKMTFGNIISLEWPPFQFSNWRFIPSSSSSGYGHGGHGGLKSNQAHTVVLDHLPIHPNELKVKIFIRPPIKYINDKDSYISNKKN